MLPPRLLFRLQRGGFIAMTALGADYALLNSAAYTAFAGHTAHARAAFGATITALGSQTAWLLSLPIHPETTGGFVQWRAYGVFAIAFAAWGLLAACGAVRRDEERGLVDQWLSAGLSRPRVLLSRTLGFAVLSAYAVTAAGAATWIGAVISGLPIEPGGIAAVSLDLWALGLASYGIGLVIAQQATTFRSAAAVGAGVLTALFLLDSLRRTSPSPAAFTQVSIFSLFDKTTAIAPGGTADFGSVAILLALGVVLIAAAVAMFGARDVGAAWLRTATVRTRVVHEVSVNPLLHVPVLRGLWQRRWPLLFWTLGFVALAAFSVSLVNATYSLFAKNAALRGFLRGLSGEVHVDILALVWFGFAQALVAVLAITTIARWAGEDGNGVLEMRLAQGVSRTEIVVERCVELAATLAIVAAVSTLVMAVTARGQGIDIAVSSALVAAALLLPFGLTFGAVGSVFTAYRPRLAQGVLGVVAVLSYLIDQIAPTLRWPSWVSDLSVFQFYGTPLVQPVYVTGLVAMVAIVVVGFGAGTVVMRHRDVAR